MENEATIQVTDDLDQIVAILPPCIKEELQKLENLETLLEVVLDLGRIAEARFPNGFFYLGNCYVTHEEIGYVVSRVGRFGKDNRAGIERTLHRISAIRNRNGDIIGLTCRVGRAVSGTINIVRDLIQTGRSILLMGRPGVGKTTLLREVARVLSDEFKKRVIVVDTSNEIAGDGDIPHPGIGNARRMQVTVPEMQHAVMIEAVENHMPEVIVVDEIGTEAEAYAARTIAERGVQLIATAHGNTLENLLLNPTLSDLIGGIQPVTLSDEEAKKRGTQKTVLERKSPPTFDMVIEIQDRDTLAVHHDVAQVVDLMLRGTPPQPEIRLRGSAGNVQVIQTSNVQELAAFAYAGGQHPAPCGKRIDVGIFPYAVSRNRLERAIQNLRVSAKIVRDWEEADLVLTLKGQERRESRKFREMIEHGVPIRSVKNNTLAQIQNFLREYFHLPAIDMETIALKEAEQAARRVLRESRAIELSPQNSRIRRLQHQVVQSYHLKSQSTGTEPNRRVRIYH